MNIGNAGWKKKLRAFIGIGTLVPETRQGHILLCMSLWSVISFLSIDHFVVSSIVVQGRSMTPTLNTGDTCFVNCWLPHLRGYARGDIVVLRDPDTNELVAKRIIGMPGDEIQFTSGRVRLNGRLIDEPYLSKSVYTYSRCVGERPFRVSADSYFVMGDNRVLSEDSRSYGDVDRAAIVGLISQ